MRTYTYRHWTIPERMMRPLLRYVHLHELPGDFLQAVLRNDLREAIGRADDENIANLPAFTSFLYNEAPNQCHGSAEKMVAWVGMIPPPGGWVVPSDLGQMEENAVNDYGNIMEKRDRGDTTL